MQRGYGPMAGLWEFPGGKVESGETPAEACERELREELKVRVSNLRDFYTLEYDYPDFHLSMTCFFCQLAHGEQTSGGQAISGNEALSNQPQANDRQRAMRWIHTRSLATLTWMPADVELVELLTKLEEQNDSAPKEEAEPRSTKSAPARRRKTKRAVHDLLDGVDTSDLSPVQTDLVRRRAAVRKSMQGNKRRDTKPELLVRQRLRAAGLTGYRLDWGKAPGRPDIAFPGRKIAIFVNGCYWHRCPHCNPSMPSKNVEFWEAKFRRNVERDARALAELEELGWCTITIWECELKRERIDETMERVIETILEASARTGKGARAVVTAHGESGPRQGVAEPVTEAGSVPAAGQEPVAEPTPAAGPEPAADHTSASEADPAAKHAPASGPEPAAETRPKTAPAPEQDPSFAD